MGLRDIISADTKAILEDDSLGFGWTISLTDPDGTTSSFIGYSTDISQIIDPDTGTIVSGRLASVSIFIKSIIDAGLEIPYGISDSSKKPWVVDFNDINGNPYKFKVSQSNPDRAMGVVVLILESYATSN